MRDEIDVKVCQFEVNSVVLDERAKEKNTDYICDVILKNADSDLVVFPELAFSGYVREFDPTGNFRTLYWERGAESITDGEALLKVARTAKEVGCHVIVGFLENSGIKYESYNSCALISPNGNIDRIHKMHIPNYEKHYFIPADGPQKVFDTALGKIGMMVCYDLTFPETARLLALQGAEIIVCPANWSATRNSSIFSTLPLARAYENQVHVVTCNSVGDWWISQSRQEVRMLGNSRIVSANADVLAESDGTACTIGAKLTSSDLKKGATFLTIFRDRTPNNYTMLTRSSSIV